MWRGRPSPRTHKRNARQFAAEIGGVELAVLGMVQDVIERFGNNSGWRRAGGRMKLRSSRAQPVSILALGDSVLANLV